MLALLSGAGRRPPRAWHCSLRKQHLSPQVVFPGRTFLVPHSKAFLHNQTQAAALTKPKRFLSQSRPMFWFCNHLFWSSITAWPPNTLDNIKSRSRSLLLVINLTTVCTQWERNQANLNSEWRLQRVTQSLYYIRATKTDTLFETHGNASIVCGINTGRK